MPQLELKRKYSVIPFCNSIHNSCCSLSVCSSNIRSRHYTEIKQLSKELEGIIAAYRKGFIIEVLHMSSYAISPTMLPLLEIFL